MDDLTSFERELRDRLLAFGQAGVRPIDALAVARSTAARPTNIVETWRGRPWIGLRNGRPATVLAVALGLLLLLVTGAAVVGTRLLERTPLDGGPRLAHLVYGLGEAIYVANWDGSNPVRVAAGDPGDPCGGLIANPGLVSPDGRLLAYRSEWSDDCAGPVTQPCNAPAGPSSPPSSPSRC